MYYIDYLKENKDSIPQEELDNWTYFGGGTEKDLRFFADRLNWDLVLAQHQLSEEFIREHLIYLDLKTVFLNQSVSKDFKREFHIEKYIDDYEEYEETKPIRVMKDMMQVWNLLK